MTELIREKLETKNHTEREDICDRLISILKLDENHSILLNDLDMKDEIKRYFAVSCLSPFKPNAICMRPYINILRGILRKQGYMFEASPILIGFENGKINMNFKI